MLTGKRVVLGVSGSISAYKMANVASMLKKLNCDVHVILTKAGSEFITPVTFEALTKNPCYQDDFDRKNTKKISHIMLGQESDLILVAPASADIIGKMAHGIADDLLSSTIVAATCPVLIAPAMNSYMYQNPMVQENLERLKKVGYEVIEPDSGLLACEVEGVGKLPKEETLVNCILKKLEELAAGKESVESSKKQDLTGKKVLVTAGPTQEAIDPVRFISNHSTGRMGYAVAEMAKKRGAEVTLVSGPVQIEAPEGVKLISVISAEDMYQAVMKEAEKQDFIIKSAAVADYRPKQVASEKIKKKEGESVLELERTKDILASLGAKKTEKQVICGFSMETQNMLENSRKKLEKKKVDLIAANSIREEGAGFASATNHLFLIEKDKEKDLGMASKKELADALLDEMLEIWERKQEP